MGDKAHLIALAKDFSYKMQQKNIDVFAGSCAYFFVVSSVPLLILVSSLLPYTAATKADLLFMITDIVPDFADDIAVLLVKEAYEQSVTVFSISALAAIWAGALAMMSIIRGLNGIYEVEEKRNYFHLRLVAAFYTLAMIVIIIIMLVIMVFEKAVRSMAVSYFPLLLNIVSVSSYFKFLFVIIIASVVFALIYTYVPSAKMSFAFQLPGAVFSAIVWYIFSWIFSLYVDYSGYYSLYGSIATAVVLLIWLYSCIYIFFIGAFINKFFHPAVKVLYDDRHKKRVRENVKKKSTKKTSKPRKYDEYG